MHGDPGAAGGGHWHDMDMLVIGNYEPRTGRNCMTLAEERSGPARGASRRAPRRLAEMASRRLPTVHQVCAALFWCGRAGRFTSNHGGGRGRGRDRTQFAIWALSASPLIMGNDSHRP